MGPMGMPNMPMGMQGGNAFMNMNNFGMNQGEDEEWLKGFALGVQEVKGTQEEVDDGRPKLNAIFTTTKGNMNQMTSPSQNDSVSERVNSISDEEANSEFINQTGLNFEIKNSISHRAEAFRKFIKSGLLKGTDFPVFDIDSRNSH